MKKAILGFVVLTGLIFVMTGCEKKVYVVEPDTTPPSSPKGVYSVTGDRTVYIYWEANDEKDFAKYNIYWSLDQNSAFTFLASTAAPKYVDRNLENGTTYYYVITAMDFSGNESGDSKLIFDTPRPEGFYLVLYDKAVDPLHAGIYFDSSHQDAAVVPWNSPLCDIYLDKPSTVFYLNTTQKNEIWNDIQDMGYTQTLDDITWAPDSGWSDLGYVEVIPGHTYVIWTWDYHYAKLRVGNVYSNSVRFEWAYQIAYNNPELKPIPKKIARKLSEK